MKSWKYFVDKFETVWLSPNLKRQEIKIPIQLLLLYNENRFCLLLWCFNSSNKHKAIQFYLCPPPLPSSLPPLSLSWFWNLSLILICILCSEIYHLSYPLKISHFYLSAIILFNIPCLLLWINKFTRQSY